ncbi:hypothetical protein PspLS_04913, partial [Pyricularia sp. CBS 133598]
EPVDDECGVYSRSRFLGQERDAATLTTDGSSRKGQKDGSFFVLRVAMRHLVKEICGPRVCLALPVPDSRCEVLGSGCLSKMGFRALIFEAMSCACVKQIVNGPSFRKQSRAAVSDAARLSLVDWRWGTRKEPVISQMAPDRKQHTGVAEWPM